MTGARLVDALTLKPSDIKEGMINFKNKISKRPEPRPISQEAINILNSLPNYIDRLFPWSHNGTSRLHKKLVSVCEELGIERNGRSFQEFRSTFRMRLLRAGTPQEYVRWLMRHKTMAMTDKFYTQYEYAEINNYLRKIG